MVATAALVWEAEAMAVAEVAMKAATTTAFSTVAVRTLMAAKAVATNWSYGGGTRSAACGGGDTDRGNSASGCGGWSYCVDIGSVRDCDEICGNQHFLTILSQAVPNVGRTRVS
jgi:hypothetical protein